MCTVDPERIAIHTNPERRGRIYENSKPVRLSDRRNDGSDLSFDKSAPERARCGGRLRAAAGTTYSCGAAGERKTAEKVPLPREQLDEEMESTESKHTTRGINQAKEHTRGRRGDDEGCESGESTRAVHTPERHASMLDWRNERRRGDEDGHEDPRRMKRNEGWKSEGTRTNARSR